MPVQEARAIARSVTQARSNTMRGLFRWALPLAVVLVAGLVAAADGPTTPLGKWMNANMRHADEDEDFAALQNDLRLVAEKPPPAADYPKWVAISKAGADAAGNKDIKGARRSCHECHDAYKPKYKKEQVSRPFP
jgi:hypothetical protein